MSAALYLETSALLSWLLGEPEGDAVRQAVDEAAVVVTSRLTLVESERGLLRAEQERRISSAERHTLMGLLARSRSEWFRLALSEPICDRAERPFPMEPVRTLDALHLASALTALRQIIGGKVQFPKATGKDGARAAKNLCAELKAMQQEKAADGGQPAETQ